MTVKTRANLKLNPSTSTTFADGQVLPAEQFIHLADSFPTKSDEYGTATLTTTATTATAAINELDAQIGAAASSSGSIGTSIDTDGTLKAGAVDVAAVLADSVVTAAKINDGALPNGNLVVDPHNFYYVPVAANTPQDLRRRWQASTTSSTQVADSTAPSGYVTRIPTTESQGRRLWLDEMRLVIGDIVSFDIYCKIPTGRTVRSAIAWRNSSGTSLGTATGTSTAGNDGMHHLVIDAQTIPSSAVAVDLYILQVSGTGNVDVHYWYLTKGNKAFTTQGAPSLIPYRQQPMNLAYDAQNELLLINESHDERLRWYNSSNLSRVAAVALTGLGTPIIRLAGTTGGGRRLWLDEMGLKPGDVISLGFTANVGSGRTFKVGYAWRTGAGASISSGSGSTTHTGTAVTALYGLEGLTIPATTEAIDIFPTSIAGTSANIDIYAWHVVKGLSMGEQMPVPGPGALALSEAGRFPATMLNFGKGYLRDWFAQLSKIKAADGTSQAVIACIGDSWMHLDARLVAPLRDWLQAEYGNGGPGWVSANSDVYLLTESRVVARSVTGTWTNRDKNSTPKGYGPDLNDAYTTDTATPAKITFTATSTPVTAVDIHYLKVTNGLGLEYQVDSGGWTTVDTNASEAHGVVSITGLSDTNGHVIEVRAAAAVTGSGAGGLTVLGIDAKRTGVNGVRVLKLGSNGSTVANWNAHPNTTVQKAIYTQMGVNLALITLGTNDHSQNVVPATFASSLDTLIATIRAASSLTLDVGLLFPSDNGNSATYAMQQYISALRATAVKNNCPALNSFLLLGDYTTANTRGLYNDASHINITGGRVIIHTFCEDMLRL